MVLGVEGARKRGRFSFHAVDKISFYQESPEGIRSS